MEETKNSDGAVEECISLHAKTPCVTDFFSHRAGERKRGKIEKRVKLISLSSVFYKRREKHVGQTRIATLLVLLKTIKKIFS